MFVLDRGPAAVIWPEYTQHEGEWEQTRDRLTTQTCLVHVEMTPGPVHSDANDVQKITMLHLADVDGTGNVLAWSSLVMYLIEISVFDCSDGTAPGVR